MLSEVLHQQLVIIKLGDVHVVLLHLLLDVPEQQTLHTFLQYTSLTLFLYQCSLEYLYV